MARLKATSEDHKVRREKCQHTLAIGMYAARNLATFLSSDDGSLDAAARESAEVVRRDHIACSSAFDKLDATLVEPFRSAPSLPPGNADLDFILARYDELVREQDERTMIIDNIGYKEDPDADSDFESVDRLGHDADTSHPQDPGPNNHQEPEADPSNMLL